MQSPLSDADVERIAAAVSVRIRADSAASLADREAMAQRGRENYYAEAMMKEQERTEAAAAIERENREFARGIVPCLRTLMIGMWLITAYCLAVMAALHGGWARYVPFAYAATEHNWTVVFWVGMGLGAIVSTLFSLACSAAKYGHTEPPSGVIKPV